MLEDKLRKWQDVRDYKVLKRLWLRRHTSQNGTHRRTMTSGKDPPSLINPLVRESRRMDVAKEPTNEMRDDTDYSKSVYWGPVARAWCRPECATKVVDVDLSIATVRQLVEELGEPKKLNLRLEKE